jgi:hypothetical protein
MSRYVTAVLCRFRPQVLNQRSNKTVFVHVMLRCSCVSSGSVRVAPLPAPASSSTGKKWIIDDFGQRIACDDSFDLSSALSDATRTAEDDAEAAAVWRTMLSQTGGISRFRSEHAAQFKSMCVRGVPSSVRAQVWMHATGASSLHRRYRADETISYHALCQRATTNPSPYLRQITVDVPRTHGTHAYFVGDASGALLRVLHCVALAHPEIGYMQGMNMIVSLFLVVCGEEESAFWLMMAYLRHYNMLDFYKDGLVRLRDSTDAFGRLLHQHRPALASYLVGQDMVPHCYCTPWFITCFAYNCQLESAARLFDVFFLLISGDAFVHRLGLAYLASREQYLTKSGFAELAVETKEMQFHENDDDSDNPIDQLQQLLKAAHEIDLNALAARANISIPLTPLPDTSDEPAQSLQSVQHPQSAIQQGEADRPQTPVIRPGSARVRVVHVRPTSASIRLKAVTTPL